MHAHTDMHARPPAGGERRITIEHERAARAADAWCGLPEGVSRWDLLRLAKEAGPARGWTDQLVLHLERLLGRSRDRDWEADSRPVVWPSVERAARECGRSESQVRRWERELMRLGALSFRDSPNRVRYGYRDRDGRIVEAWGLDLSPLAGLAERLAVDAAAVREEEARSADLRQELRAARGDVSAVLGSLAADGRLSADEAGELRRTADGLGRKPSVGEPLEVLAGRLGELRAMRRRLGVLLADADGPADMPFARGGEIRTGMTGRPVINDRPARHRRASYLNTTRNQVEDLPVAAPVAPDAKVVAPSADAGPEPVRPPPVPVRRGGMRPVGAVAADPGPPPGPLPEGEGGPPRGTPRRPRTGAERLSLRSVLRVLPRRIGGFLLPGADGAADWHSLVRAVERAVPGLGISPGAWREACETLGSDEAALAVIVTASKFEGGVVRRPGGYLRELTRRGEVGELDLAGSVHGLLDALEAGGTVH